VDTARVRYLAEAEWVRLVNACEPAFRNLLRGALLTGCRHSEWASMKAADFNSDAGVVTFRQGKNQTSDVVPRPTSHPRLDARNARGADRSHSRAIGHTDTRMTEKLAPCPELCRRYDPRAFPDAWNYGRRHCDTDTIKSRLSPLTARARLSGAVRAEGMRFASSRLFGRSGIAEQAAACRKLGRCSCADQ
jgi:integrase